MSHTRSHFLRDRYMRCSLLPTCVYTQAARTLHHSRLSSISPPRTYVLRLQRRHILVRDWQFSREQTLSEACQLAKTATPPQHSSTVLDTGRDTSPLQQCQSSSYCLLKAAERAAIASQDLQEHHRGYSSWPCLLSQLLSMYWLATDPSHDSNEGWQEEVSSRALLTSAV